MSVENNAILSKQGDITIAYEVILPELFTLSDQEYETVHQAFIRAIKVLPKHSIFHKQDWFTETNYGVKFEGDTSFLSRSSERFFHERPYLDHRCYILLTKKPAGRRIASSLFSNLLRKSIVPEQTLRPQLLQDFLDSAGQFEKILSDSGFIKLKRLTGEDLSGDEDTNGIIERYLNLHPYEYNCVLKDLSFKDEIRVGTDYCQIFTLADAQNLPSFCGSRINFDKYSTDKTKFSVGFALPLGQLLSCNHIYNQYIFIEDAQKTIQKLESKRLRLQSLSAYSRENAISKEDGRRNHTIGH